MPQRSRPSTPDFSVYSRAACRVDFAGGTLDLWPLYLFHPGAVTVNAAVKVHTTCKIHPRKDGVIELRSVDTGRSDTFASFDKLMKAKKYEHALAAYLVRWFEPKVGFTMETHSESPAGAGISGSSAMMIASTAALARFTGRELEREQIRVIAQNIEAQLIRVPTGCQDYYPALYGGLNAIHLGEEGIRREEIAIDHHEVERRFVLAYTGAPRKSGINNWAVFKAHIDGEKNVHRNFDRIGEIARQMRQALVDARWPEIARLLREEWKHRRSNAPGIATPYIDKLVEVAKKSGARAAKVCGAGGGGCVVFMVDPEARDRVQAALEKAKARVLPFQIEPQGVTVSAVHPGEGAAAR